MDENENGRGKGKEGRKLTGTRERGEVQGNTQGGRVRGILATLTQFLYNPKKPSNFTRVYVLLRRRSFGAAKSWQLSCK